MSRGSQRRIDMHLGVFGRVSVVVGCFLTDLLLWLARLFLSFGVLRDFDNLLVGSSLFFGFRFLLGFRLAIEFGNRLLRIFDQAVMRIALQELAESAASLLGIIQVVTVDLANGEQVVATVFAAGILTPQKPVLADGFVQDLVVIEAASHLNQRFRNRHYAGISLGGRGCAIVDVAVGVDNSLIVAAGTVGGRTSIERFPHALGGGEAVAGPR